jgi:hypothetical protein
MANHPTRNQANRDLINAALKFADSLEFDVSDHNARLGARISFEAAREFLCTVIDYEEAREIPQSETRVHQVNVINLGGRSLR